mgnify:CR=1 FL=1
MFEVKEYVSVDEKKFWQEKSLNLTVKWSILDSNLRKKVTVKLDQLNAKIDKSYDVTVLDNWDKDIWTAEIKNLTEQLKKNVAWFNEEISKIEQKYIWRTVENQWLIQSEISQYFSDKSIFTPESAWLASLTAYRSGDREMAQNRKNKLPLS